MHLGSYFASQSASLIRPTTARVSCNISPAVAVANLTADFYHLLDDIACPTASEPSNISWLHCGWPLHRDITVARSRLRYECFIRQLSEEVTTRNEFYEIFDRTTKAVFR